MSDRDDAAAAYYEDPENRRLKGSGQKRARQPGRLTTHVPVRFSSAIIERVKDLASRDGKTVSSWIRDVIEGEVLRRERSTTVGVEPTIEWKPPTREPVSSTRSSGEQTVEELCRLAG
jgi:predicted DNA binding CopG/RHH family protein